jgi:hypothetical protein
MARPRLASLGRIVVREEAVNLGVASTVICAPFWSVEEPPIRVDLFHLEQVARLGTCPSDVTSLVALLPAYTPKLTASGRPTFPLRKRPDRGRFDINIESMGYAGWLSERRFPRGRHAIAGSIMHHHWRGVGPET